MHVTWIIEPLKDLSNFSSEIYVGELIDENECVIFAPLKNIVSEYRFVCVDYEVIVMDIGKLSNDKNKLMEFNSFSCAGLYACDTDKIVEKISIL